MPDPSSFREAELSRQLAEARREIELLREKIDLLVRKLFGAKSEKLDPAQLLLLLQGLDEPGKAPEPVVAEAARRSTAPSPPRERGPRLPEHLPVIEEVIVPELVQLAPQDWRRIGEEVSDKLDYEPGRFLCRRTVRPKYVRRGVLDAVPIVAPLPESLLERSLVTPGLLAQILVAKYCDHLPLYRQEAIYWSRHEVWLPRQTMAEWVGLAAEWLQPIYNLIRNEVFGQGYVQVDETPIRYLAPGHGKTKLGYLWTCGVPRGGAIFHWETSRAATCLENIIPADFRGTLQCDGYEAYDCFARRRGEQIVLAGCLAHVRRKFYDARETAPKVAVWFLAHFQNLYRLETELRKARAGPKLRAVARASLSRPVLARLHRALMRLKIARRYLPQSHMGKAIDYALNQWPSLHVFLEDGRVEIDNNLVENAIRPTAIGKKNWLFIGDAHAGGRSAIIYTLIECCRRRGLDPFAYLRDVFTRLPTTTNWQVKELTPEAWAKTQKRVDGRAAA
ncbi:MAG: IS66 family transposase [Chthoniobacteraceae bacterium]